MAQLTKRPGFPPFFMKFAVSGTGKHSAANKETSSTYQRGRCSEAGLVEGQLEYSSGVAVTDLIAEHLVQIANIGLRLKTCLLR